MLTLQRIELEGKRFVVLPEIEYNRLCREAGKRTVVVEDDLPPLPKPDKSGRVPALEFARISLARDVISARKEAGLTQQQLADLAGIRQETLSRIENGKHTASPRTIDKIMDVIEKRQREKPVKGHSPR